MAENLINPDVIFTVLDQLESEMAPQYICILAQTCSRANQMMNQSFVWKGLYEKRFSTIPPTFNELIRRLGWKRALMDRIPKEAAMIPGSAFHTQIFDACGKLPKEPRLDLLLPLLASPLFSGCADDYVDENRSTLLMYCVGPANSQSLPMAQLLALHGANPAWSNAKSQTAMAYVKAWKDHGGPQDEPLYLALELWLREQGCDPREAPAF
mmetsp:Transcript_18061/g.49880  ORF Transcript_18061/g.49880 Transcript_18061/m.49880 type:complete len:211 (-) Transcript_18061:137-769(-)